MRCTVIDVRWALLQKAHDVGSAADVPNARSVDGSVLEEWDVARSLFDNHISASFEDNLAYMYKHFGFYFPDAEYLTDPEGLLRCATAVCSQRVRAATSNSDALRLSLAACKCCHRAPLRVVGVLRFRTVRAQPRERRQARKSALFLQRRCRFLIKTKS